MTKESLLLFKRLTTWGGFFISIGGISYSISKGGDVIGAYITLFGTLTTSIGAYLAAELSKLEKVDREKAENRLRDLEEHRMKDWAKGQPRQFPKDKIPNFIREVKRGIDGPVTISLHCLRTDDGEAYDLATNICDALGFDHGKIGDIISSPKGVRDIEICDNTSDGTPTLMAENLIRAFEVVGLKTTYKEGPKGNKQPLIIIGKKST